MSHPRVFGSQKGLGNLDRLGGANSAPETRDPDRSSAPCIQDGPHIRRAQTDSGRASRSTSARKAS
jgi:hypothetical protein